MSGKIMVALSPFTTFRIGGQARVVTAYNAFDLAEFAESEKSIVLGRASNVLVSDNGVRELVVLNRTSEISIEGDVVAADSGVTLSVLASYYCEKSFSGFEWACGIPGSVGGALVSNAGAFGASVADVLVGATVLRGGKIRYVPVEACEFGERSSCFTASDVIVRAYFMAKSAPREEILVRVAENRRLRRERQPIGFSAGSIFKKADKAAGWYIERAGLKGFRVGGAVVSGAHANFIINDNFATSRDVRLAIDTIKAIVFDKFSVCLEEEIRYIGDY